MRLNVLLLSNQIRGIDGAGGLGDVAIGLAKAVASRGDVNIRLAMPGYGDITENQKLRNRFSHTRLLRGLEGLAVPFGWATEHVDVFEIRVPECQPAVSCFLFRCPAVFDARDPATGRINKNSPDKAIFFARTALEFLRVYDVFHVDVIHCNDWHTGLVPVYLKTLYKDDPFYKDTRTVFTVHNMAYQGVFPRSSFDKTLLPADTFSPAGVESHGNLNFLKAGLVYADALTTVSGKYAEEIAESDEFGCGLQDVIRKRKKDLTGILNGVDYSQWDPSADELLPHRYDVRTLDLKAENKKVLCGKMHLPFQEDVPLIGIISRLADQKGFDLIDEVIDQILKLPCQMVVLGTGEKRYHDLFEKAAKKHPQKLAVSLTFNNDLAHLIEAGSDIFLMPSRYEPCGLNQIYSLRYGTIPVVRATGGLDDTIQDCGSGGASCTGFKFTGYSSSEMLAAIQRALVAFGDQPTWKKLMKNGMAKDFSWEASAKKYIQLYRSLVKR